MFDWLTFLGTVIGMVLGILFVSSPIWLPLFLAGLAWNTWLDYIRRKDLASREFVLIEIKIPKEVKKSPFAMEVILGAFFNTGGEGNWFEKYWKGGSRPWFSLEIISIGGSIHFLIWTEKKNKNLIESQIYSQYPGVEIYEVPDYCLETIYDPEKNKMWGGEMVLTKSDAYPIKTYTDYGLTGDLDTQTDPLSVTMEFLGSLTEGQQAWIQIMIQAHKKGKLGDSWQDSAKKEIEKIVEEAKLKKKDDTAVASAFALSQGQQEAIKAIEKSVEKMGFDTGIRMIYFAEKDKFNPGNIGGLINTFKQFSSTNLNGFKPNNTTKFDYPWQDYREKRVNKKKKKILNNYKKRAYFPPFYSGKAFVLNTEELATIYHFPGKVIQTPTLGRISSKKAEPPANLPI